MKKNSSQWSMSNPAGNAVCYRDAESACLQPASPMVAANSTGLPSQGGTWAGCHAVSLGQTHWFVLEGKGSKEHRGRTIAYCQALLLPLISCTSFWEAPCGLSFSRCFPPTPQGLEASFKAYWSEREWHLTHPRSQVSTISRDSPLVPLVMKTNLTLDSLSALGEDFCHVASPSLASLAFYNCTSTLSWIGLVLASSLSFQWQCSLDYTLLRSRQTQTKEEMWWLQKCSITGRE